MRCTGDTPSQLCKQLNENLGDKVKLKSLTFSSFQSNACNSRGDVVSCSQGRECVRLKGAISSVNKFLISAVIICFPLGPKECIAKAKKWWMLAKGIVLDAVDWSSNKSINMIEKWEGSKKNNEVMLNVMFQRYEESNPQFHNPKIQTK